MKEIFARLIQALPGGNRGRDREEPERLGREVVRLQEEGRYRQAEDAARRLVEVQRERLGDRHADYASALSSLAVLLQTRGDLAASEPLVRQALEIRAEALGEHDPQYAASLGQLAALLKCRGDISAAEPLMRRCLEIRRETLGEHHPDYAASLSQLGAVLFERQDHLAAEPLLRQAVTIRKDALGSRHRDVVADMQTLDAIVAARAGPRVMVQGLRGRGSEAVPIPAAASDSALEQLGRGPREIAAEARGLAETFARIGAALAHAARGMQHGLPPQIALLNDSAACHNAFAAIEDEALRRAEAVELAPAEGTLLGLHDLAALMDRVGQVEDELTRRSAVRREALAVLDRVLTLRHRVPTESSLLTGCHEMAFTLRQHLAEAPVKEALPDDASQLAAGRHPLAGLVRLIEPLPPLTDDDWSRLHREVSASFGRPLAAAAVRGRLGPSPSLSTSPSIVRTANGKADVA